MRKTISVFVSSPGDVQAERILAGGAIERVQARYRNFVRLEPVLWEQQPLRATAHFNEELIKPSDCEIFVCILWSRLGSPLPPQFQKGDGSRYDSGTEWELEEAMQAFERRAERDGPDAARPHILVYRRTEEPDFSASPDEAAARDQSVKLAEFIERFFKNTDGTNRRAFHSYQAKEDFAERFEKHLEQRIRGELPTIMDSGQLDPVPVEGSPFKGLNAFEIRDAALFFGRNRAIEEVLSQIKKLREREHAFLLIYGGSGFGKSSLMRAGIAFALTEPGHIPEAGQWKILDHFPARGDGSPCEILARALFSEAMLPELGSIPGPFADEPANWDVARLTRCMETDPALAAAGVEQALAEATSGEKTHLCILLDQLEEIFTRDCFTEKERNGFFAALAFLSERPTIWILATMRSEFFERIPHYEALHGLVRHDGDYILEKPSLDDLGKMIRIPALAAGLSFEVNPETNESLSAQIYEEMKGDPAALPLLQFTLQQLYERRSEEEVLTWAAYREIGGVEGAIARVAEETYRSLENHERGEAQKCFAELVTVSSEGKASRKSADLGRLRKIDGAAGFVDAFVRANLLVTGGDRDRQTLELAHEALITHWPILEEWIGRHRDLIRYRARLAESAALFGQQGAASPDRKRSLLSGLRLEEAVVVEASGFFSLTGNESELIRRSRQAKQRRFQQLIAAVVGFALLACVAVFQANRARQKQREATELLAASYSGEADRLFREGDSLAALPRLIRALELKSDTGDSGDLLHTAILSTLSRAPELEGLWIHESPVTQVAVSADGRRIITSDEDGFAEVRSFPGLERLGKVAHGARISCLGIHPGNTMFFTAGHEGNLRLWSLDSFEELAEPIRNTGVVNHAAFAPGGDWLAAAAGRKNVMVVNRNLATGTKRISTGSGYITVPRMQKLPMTSRGQSTWWAIRDGLFDPEVRGTNSHTGWASHVAFDPEGNHLLSTGSRTSGAGSKAAVLDLENGESVEIEPGLGNIAHGGFDRAGSRVALAVGNPSSPGALVIADARTGELVMRPFEQPERLTRARFSPADDNRVLTAGDDGNATIWNVEGRQVMALLPHKAALTEAAYDAGGETILTAAEDGSVRVWDAAGGRPLSPYLWHSDPVASAGFIGNPPRVVSGGADGVVRVWNPRSPSGGPEFSVEEEFPVRELAFASDGAAVIAAGGTINLMTMGTDREAERREVETVRKVFARNVETGSEVLSVTPRKEGGQLIVAVGEGALVLVDQESPEKLSWHDGSTSNPVSISCSETVLDTRVGEGGRLVAAMTGKGLEVHRIRADGTFGLAFSEPVEGEIDHFEFSPGGEILALVEKGRTLAVFDTATGERRGDPFTLPGKSAVSDLVMAPGGSGVLVISRPGVLQTERGGRAYLWSDQRGGEPAFVSQNRRILTAAFSADGRMLVTAGELGECRIWKIGGEIETGLTIQHPDDIVACGFADDPAILVTGSADGGLRFWNPNSGHLVAPPIWHPKLITSLALSPGTGVVATGCEDGVIRGWKLSHARESIQAYRNRAALLLGKELDETDTLVPLTPENLRVLWDQSR